MDRSEGRKMSIAARSSRDARVERAPILGDQLEIATDRLSDALSEIAFLRQVLWSAAIGSSIIERQFEGTEEGSLLRWAATQAKSNREHAETWLTQSREDFPFEGRSMLAAALSDGALPRHSPETPAEPKPPTSNLSGEAG